MAYDSTTVRISWRAHRILSELAGQRDITMTELFDRLAERERREAILTQSSERLTELLADPKFREEWFKEIQVSG
jgi:predicted DNA-binding ribbon-helix-helix protein